MKSTIIPKNSSDLIAFLIMLSLLHIVVFYELFIILPYIDSNKSTTYWFHVFLGFFLYINIITAIFKLLFYDSSTSGLVLPSLLLPGWRYCSQCQTNSPPRSHHCWICNLCITRRDHHCTFIGKCIGHKNQRFFLSLLLYFSIGSIYCNFLNFDYTIEVLGGLNFKSFFSLFLPLFSWALNFNGHMSFIVSFISATCLISMVFFLYLLAYHLVNIINGQTSSERGKGCHDYSSCSYSKNIESMIGHQWLPSILLPWLNFDDLSSGLEFKSSTVKYL